MTARAVYIRDGWAKCQACGSLFLVAAVQTKDGKTDSRHCPSCGERVEIEFKERKEF